MKAMVGLGSLVPVVGFGSLLPVVGFGSLVPVAEVGIHLAIESLRIDSGTLNENLIYLRGIS
jgi:hypothetical protein